MIDGILAGLFLLLAAAVSTALTGLFRLYALNVSLLDQPNARSSHSLPTPRGGGIAIVFTFLGSSFVLCWYGLIPAEIFGIVAAGGGMVALVGFVDDHQHLSARLRFCVHAAAAAGVLFFLEECLVLPWLVGEINLGAVGYFLVAVSLVWLLNLYNFMDGIDAIAGLETISVACGGALILWFNHAEQGYSLWLLLLAATTSGFLIWNLPPAKIFMGDACSGFLGFVFGMMAIATSSTGAISIWSWTILLAVFIVDATVTLIRRIVRGETFYKAHRSHAYQILSRRFDTHLKVSLGVLFVNVFWLLPLSFLVSIFPEQGIVVTVLAFAPLILYAMKVGAGTRTDIVKAS